VLCFVSNGYLTTTPHFNVWLQTAADLHSACDTGAVFENHKFETRYIGSAHTRTCSQICSFRRAMAQQ